MEAAPKPALNQAQAGGSEEKSPAFGLVRARLDPGTRAAALPWFRGRAARGRIADRSASRERSRGPPGRARSARSPWAFACR